MNNKKRTVRCTGSTELQYELQKTINYTRTTGLCNAKTFKHENFIKLVVPGLMSRAPHTEVDKNFVSDIYMQ